jgi:hypothetical protein
MMGDTIIPMETQVDAPQRQQITKARSIAGFHAGGDHGRDGLLFVDVRHCIVAKFDVTRPTTTITQNTNFIILLLVFKHYIWDKSARMGKIPNPCNFSSPLCAQFGLGDWNLIP